MDMAVVMDGAIAAAAGTITDGAEVVATIMVGGIATEVEEFEMGAASVGGSSFYLVNLAISNGNAAVFTTIDINALFVDRDSMNSWPATTSLPRKPKPALQMPTGEPRS
jgi:hypothetical protein